MARGLSPIFRTRRLPPAVEGGVEDGDCEDHGLNTFMIFFNLELEEDEFCESWLLCLDNMLYELDSSPSFLKFIAEDISSSPLLAAPWKRRRARQS